MALGAVILVGLVSLPFLILPIRVEIGYTRKKGNDNFWLHVHHVFTGRLTLRYLDFDPVTRTFRLAGRFSLPFLARKVKRRGKPSGERISYRRLPGMLMGTIRKVASVWPLLREVFGAVSVERFLWKTDLGTGDAKETAEAAGLLWTIKGNILSFLERCLRVDSVEVNVRPHFNAEVFETEVLGIFTFRLGKIILVGLSQAVRMLWEGAGQWKNTLFRV